MVGLARFATAVTVLLSAALAAVLFVAAGAIERGWHQPGPAGPVAVMALAVPAIALGAVWREGLRGFQDVRLASLLEKVGIPGLTAVALLAAVAAGASGVTAAAAAVAVAYVATGALAGVHLWNESPAPSERRPSISVVPGLVSPRSCRWKAFCCSFSNGPTS